MRIAVTFTDLSKKDFDALVRKTLESQFMEHLPMKFVVSTLNLIYNGSEDGIEIRPVKMSRLDARWMEGL